MSNDAHNRERAYVIPRQQQSSTSAIQIPQTAPAGGLTITQPPQTATSFYKIAPSQFITFAWNFTYVLATPTSLTLSAVGDNGNTYPVGPTNGIIAGTSTSVVWDPWAYNQNTGGRPTLGMGTYTLKIWGDQGSDAPRAPGYLQPNTALKFGLYTPQPYTPIASGWSCLACSSADSLSCHPAFLGVMITFVIMVLSGWGILRR